MRRRFQVGLLPGLVLLAACDGDRQALNSERIREQFGTYGVEVLQADAGRRVSSLYSEDPDTGRICRTFALVEFAVPVAPQVLAEHERIVAGQSIGQVFVDAGWKIDKVNLFIGESSASEHGFPLDELMQIDARESLATHRYTFVVESGGRRIEYATITEVHHPDYLDPLQLQSIYD